MVRVPREVGMMKRIKILLALAVSIAMIAIGQRSQSVQKDARTQKAELQGLDSDTEAWFI